MGRDELLPPSLMRHPASRFGKATLHWFILVLFPTLTTGYNWLSDGWSSAQFRCLRQSVQTSFLLRGPVGRSVCWALSELQAWETTWQCWRPRTRRKTSTNAALSVLSRYLAANQFQAGCKGTFKKNLTVDQHPCLFHLDLERLTRNLQRKWIREPASFV